MLIVIVKYLRQFLFDAQQFLTGNTRTKNSEIPNSSKSTPMHCMLCIGHHLFFVCTHPPWYDYNPLPGFRVRKRIASRVIQQGSEFANQNNSNQSLLYEWYCEMTKLHDNSSLPARRSKSRLFLTSDAIVSYKEYIDNIARIVHVCGSRS